MKMKKRITDQGLASKKPTGDFASIDDIANHEIVRVNRMLASITNFDTFFDKNNIRK